MSALLLLFLIPFQETSFLQEEIDRISAKSPLTLAQRGSYKNVGAKEASSSKKIYSLAVLPIHFPGEGPVNPAPLFREQVRDYYSKESKGSFRLPVKRYPETGVGSSRVAFGKIPIRSAGETRIFKTILRQWIHRKGKAVLALHDGVAFLVEGRIGARGSILWPHQGSLSIDGITVQYVVMPADAGKHATGIAAHEFGHLLGLKDRYSMKQRCLMGTGYEQDRPASLCVFCRLQLGWLKVADFTPAGNKRFFLRESEVFRLTVNPAGTEKMVLTVRNQKLVIWREFGGAGREYIGLFPTRSRDRCTPLSQPGFTGTSTGAREIWVTDIRAENGTAWFHLSGQGVPTPLERHHKKSIGQRLGP